MIRGEENRIAYRQEMIEYHTKKRESLPPTDAVVNNPKKLWQCEICDKVFKSDGGYKYHMTHVCFNNVATAVKTVASADRRAVKNPAVSVVASQLIARLAAEQNQMQIQQQLQTQQIQPPHIGLNFDITEDTQQHHL
jgi:hypothetical protein